MVNESNLAMVEEGRSFSLGYDREYTGFMAGNTSRAVLVTMSLLAVMPATSHGVGNTVPVMDKVVVTASRQEESISTVPASVTVISSEEIANSPAETVPELLRTTPGVVVNDITGNGRNITVDMRGFGETSALNTLLLIDGRRINQADLSGVDWTLIPKDRIERIEIVRGGRGSVLYGDNAAGGVINIITKTGDDLLYSGGMTAGSYNSFISRAGVSGSTENLSFAFTGNFRTSDGYRDNSGTDAKDAGLNLEYFASDRFSIAMTSGYHTDDTDVPGSLLLSELASGISRTASTKPEDYSDTEDYYIQVVPKYYLTDTSFVKLESSARRKDNQAFFSFVGGTFDADTKIDTVAISPLVAVNEKIFGYDARLVAGFDYKNDDEKLANQSIFFGASSQAKYKISKETAAVYGSGEVSVTDAVIVSAGYRYDHADYSSKSGGVSDSVTMDESLYNAGLTYLFSETNSAYFTYAKSFRYPVIDEMFSFFTNTFDTTLNPQTTDDFEIGTRVQVGPEVNLGVNLFWLATEDEIFFNPARYANENYDGDTTRKGIELTISKSFSRVELHGSYTFRDAEFDSGVFDGKEVPNVPRHQFTAGVEARILEKVRFSMDGTYVGERPYISDFDNTYANQKSYTYLTAKLSYLFEKGSAYVTVNNLLDKEYSEYGGINFLGEPGIQPAPEINFLVGVEIAL